MVKIQIVIYIYNGSIATKDKSSLRGREFLHLDKLSLSPSVNSSNVDDLWSTNKFCKFFLP